MTYLFAFFLGLSGDYLACKWLSYRDAGHLVKAMLISITLEALSWAPVLLVVLTMDIYVAPASVAGAGLGTYLGLRQKRVKEVSL